MNSKTGKLPILLSALVYPGVGQFVQRRTRAGIVYVSLFTLGLVAFSVYSVEILEMYYGLALDFSGYQTPENVPTLQMIVAFAFSIVIYMANIVDVCRGRLKATDLGDSDSQQRS